MEVTFEITHDDLWQSHLYFRRHKASLGPLYFSLLLGICGIVCVEVVFLAWNAWRRYNQQEWSLLLPVIVLILIALVLVFSRLLPPTKSHLVKMHQSRPEIFCEHHLSISPQWFSENTHVNESKIVWTAFTEIEEDGEYLYFFVSKTNAHVVPTRAFNSATEAYTFLDRSRRYWNAAKNGTPIIGEDDTVWPPAPRPGA